jgi:hypothetical protein
MSKTFREPDFCKGEIELRFEDDIVCIYATPRGLEKIVDFCQELIEHPNVGHIHFESYGLLTAASKKGAVAVFAKKE